MFEKELGVSELTLMHVYLQKLKSAGTIEQMQDCTSARAYTHTHTPHTHLLVRMETVEGFRAFSPSRLIPFLL